MRPSPDENPQEGRRLASGGFVGPAPGEQDEEPYLVCLSPGWLWWEVREALASPQKPHFTEGGGEIA